MRYALLLILSLFSISKVQASQSEGESVVSRQIPNTEHLTEPVPAANIALDYNLTEGAIKGFITSSVNNYPVQLGAFRLKLNADAFLREVKEYIDKNAIMIKEGSYYKILISRFPEPEKSEQIDSDKSTVKQIQNPADTINNNDTIQASSVVPHYTGTDTVISNTSNDLQKSSNEADNIIFIKGDSPWLKRISYFGKSIAFINALILSIVISIVSMLILLIIILLNRRRMEKEEKLHQYLMEKYQTLIVDYLFGNATTDDFRPIASNTYRRQVLIDQMIDVSINLKGEEAKKLLSLYKHLGLDRDSVTRAYDRRWHKKIKGFRELAFMNIKDANEAIYKALNSSNEILRMEAQIALVRLGDDNPFEFLSHLTRPFSLWEQITLHELIIQHNIAVPSFKKWLTSPNPTVIMFAIRMIREFKQMDAEEDIHETLKHPDPSVRQLAVQVAGDLEMRSTLEPMKRMYKNQEYNICLEIVKSMGKMPDPPMMGFLKLVLDKEDDVQLQIEATKAIENNGEEGVKALVKIMKSEYKNYNIIVRHVLDRRIF
jgi:hypothetical protein